jgi:hypothetical protein
MNISITKALNENKNIPRMRNGGSPEFKMASAEEKENGCHVENLVLTNADEKCG